MTARYVRWRVTGGGDGETSHLKDSSCITEWPTRNENQLLCPCPLAQVCERLGCLASQGNAGRSVGPSPQQLDGRDAAHRLQHLHRAKDSQPLRCRVGPFIVEVLQQLLDALADLQRGFPL